MMRSQSRSWRRRDGVAGGWADDWTAGNWADGRASGPVMAFMTGLRGALRNGTGLPWHWRPSNRAGNDGRPVAADSRRSAEHTTELPSLMRISYAVFCLQKKKQK